MGCCYSYEEDADDRDRQFHPSFNSPSYIGTVPTQRGPATTTFSWQTSYDPYSYNYRADDRGRSVVPQRPAAHVIGKPTPAPVASSSRNNHVPKPNQFKPPAGALFGEFKCRCGNFWVSRLSWRDRYQQCKRCKAQVRPRNQRDLRPSDFTQRDQVDDSLAHPQELCEMCKQVGAYCGSIKYANETRARI